MQPMLVLTENTSYLFKDIEYELDRCSPMSAKWNSAIVRFYNVRATSCISTGMAGDRASRPSECGVGLDRILTNNYHNDKTYRYHTVHIANDY